MIEDVIFEKEEDEASLEKKINTGSTLSFTAHTVKHVSTKRYNQITLIDSPGYGHSLNNKKWLKEIIEYMKKRVNIPFSLRITPTITLKTRLIYSAKSTQMIAGSICVCISSWAQHLKQRIIK
jgi:hypothetical protein